MLPTNNINKPSVSSDSDPAFKRRTVKPEQTTNKIPSSSSSSNLVKQQHGHHHHHHHIHLQPSDSKLYIMSTIELKDPLESTLEEVYNKLQNFINPSQQSDSSVFNELSQYANQSKQHNDEVLNALLYSILTDPSNCSKCLRNLFLCNNLSFNFSNQQPESSNTPYAILIANLMSIISETYSKLQDTPRLQLIWLLKELVKSRVNQFDKLLLQMLRNIQSGCLTEKNIWLAESLLDILSDQTTTTNPNQEQASQGLWIYQYNELMTQSVYTYLRLISDQAQSSTLQQLRQREADFCVQILREKWNDCMLIGKDLVRLLQNLSRIPEFESLWKDIIQSPQILSPQFSQLGGLLYLMKLPTKRRCLICRLTVDMERKIYFIITQVKGGQQKKYLEWFQRQYLNTPESQSLRVDIIRYICVVVHPTNEQLNAGLTPRWALCSWLLNTCTSPIDSANLKLALFYDWLLYDAKKDNIMLIEPAILLMFNLIRPNNIPGLTLSMLFDFLCRIAVNYHIPFKEHILNGIMQSFKDCVDKRVIPSTQIFFGTHPDPKTQQPVPCLDRDLKNLIQITFGNFFQTLNLKPVDLISTPPSTLTPVPSPAPSPTPSSPQINLGTSQSLFKQVEAKQEISEVQTQIVKPESVTSIPVTESIHAAFSSDDEEDLEVKTVTASSIITTPSSNLLTVPTINQETSQTTNLIQLQIQQFIQKPFKIYTTLDDTQTVLQSLTTNNLQQNMNIENQLSLIHSDDVREKLNELNLKLKEYYQSLQSSLSSSWSTKCFLVNSLFKDCLTFVSRDPELSDLSTDLAVCLSIMFKNDFTNNLLPNQFYKNELSLLDLNCFSLLNETITQKPIFVLFKELSTTTNLSNEREFLVQLLSELYLKQNRIGYYFLFYIYTIYLKNSSNTSSNNELNSLIRIFKEFIQERNSLSKNGAVNLKDDDLEKISSTSESVTDESESANESDDEGEKFTENDLVLGNCLMQDLRLCQQDDPYLFCFLLPFVCGPSLLPNYMINNSELIYLIVSCIDTRQLKDFVASIISQDLELLRQPEEKKSPSKNKVKTQSNKKGSNSLKRKRKSSENEKSKISRLLRSKSNGKGKFKKENLIDVLNSSLNWESIEQIFFWELIMAHDDITLNYLLPLFNRLDPIKHSEAVSYIFQMIRSSDPTYDLFKYVIQRKVEDNLARSLFINWARKTSKSQMSQIFVKLLNKSATQTSTRSETTLKKIKYNESLTSNNKVKLTAQQQLEQNQKRTGGTNNSSLYDEEDLNKIPSIEQVLSHLNKLRSNDFCLEFILTETMRETLKKIYNKYLDDDVKKKYIELFTLADDISQKDCNSEDDGEEDEGDDDQNSNSEEDEKTNKNKKGRNLNKKGSSNKRGKKQNKNKQNKKQKQKASSSGDEDNQEDDEDQEEDDDNEEDDQSGSDNSSSESEYSKKGKSKQKRGKITKNSNQQPPRKKLKHLKGSDNDSD